MSILNYVIDKIDKTWKGFKKTPIYAMRKDYCIGIVIMLLFLVPVFIGPIYILLMKEHSVESIYAVLGILFVFSIIMKYIRKNNFR